MRRLLLRIVTAIQLTRLTIAFGAVSDIWFVILLTRASDDYVMIDVHGGALIPALLAGAVVAVGLFAYGAALNDVLDARHDAAFSPERPIPAGRIRPGQAVVVTVGSLIVAVLGGAGLGTWAVSITLLTAAGVLFFNATAKYIPALGILTIGLIHAAHMFIPNHELAFTLPVWLVMSHAMLISAMVHVLEDKRPRLKTRSVAATIVGWVFWSVLIIGAGWMSGDGFWPAPASWAGLLWPAAAVAGFVVVAVWKTRRVGPRAAAEKLKRYGAMWQSLYGAAWLKMLGLDTEAMGIAVFALVGFVTMTAIKEVSGVTGRPVTFRA